MTWNTTERQTFSNITADTSAFTLHGGQYAVEISATWGGGSVTLARLSLDGSTYVTCLTAFSANGYSTVNLPPGTYKFVVATATAVYAEIVSVVIAK